MPKCALSDDITVSCRRPMKINEIEHKLHLNTSKEAKHV